MDAIQKHRISGKLRNLRSAQQVCWMKGEGEKGEQRRWTFPI